MGTKSPSFGATGNVRAGDAQHPGRAGISRRRGIAIASRKSMGVEVSFGDDRLKCRDLEQFDFKGVDFALMSAGSAVAKAWRRASARKGASSSIIPPAGAWTPTFR